VLYTLEVTELRKDEAAVVKTPPPRHFAFLTTPPHLVHRFDYTVGKSARRAFE